MGPRQFNPIKIVHVNEWTVATYKSPSTLVWARLGKNICNDVKGNLVGAIALE